MSLLEFTCCCAYCLKVAVTTLDQEDSRCPCRHESDMGICCQIDAVSMMPTAVLLDAYACNGVKNIA